MLSKYSEVLNELEKNYFKNKVSIFLNKIVANRSPSEAIIILQTILSLKIEPMYQNFIKTRQIWRGTNVVSKVEKAQCIRYLIKSKIDEQDQLLDIEWNDWQIKALKSLRPYGLNNRIMLNFMKHNSLFVSEHYEALLSLVKQRNYSLQKALVEITNLTPEQAEGISQGLSRHEVIQLNNFWQIKALWTLKENGLTAEMLMDFGNNRFSFNKDHCIILIKLVNDYHYLIDDALAEMAPMEWISKSS